MASSKQACILQDVFHSHPSHTPCSLCLTERTLYVRKACNGKLEHNDINVSDIVGCQVVVKKSKASGEASCYLRVYYYPLQVTGGILSKQLKRNKQVASFVMRKFQTYEENANVINKWKCVLLWMLRCKQFGAEGSYKIPDVLPPPRKLLFIVNPRSGPGRASSIFKDQVVPLMAESGTQYDMLVTDRANCGKDYMKEADLSKWNGIVAVSGDGLLFEIFNGLMERDDWKTAIKIPVGVVPGGSGNGLARAINYASGEPYDTNVVTSSILNIISGRVSPMDLIKVETPLNTVYSFLSIGWGLMADIDIESEKFRAIGEARFTIWAVIRALGLRKYRGKLSYLPVIGYSPQHKSKVSQPEEKIKRSKTVDLVQSDDFNTRNGFSKAQSSTFRSKSFVEGKSEIPELECNRKVELLQFSQSGEFSQKSDSSYSQDTSSYVDSLDKNLSSENSESSCDSLHAGLVDSNDDDSVSSFVSCSSIPPLSEPVPGDWVVVDGEFVLVYVAHQTHLSSDVLFAPDAKLDDGVMWLVMMRSDVSRAQVIYFLASLQTGDHVNIPYVDVIPVHAFRLEPHHTDSVLTVDGEVIPCSPIQATVLPSVARVMTR